jgi:hypothetical protein
VPKNEKELEKLIEEIRSFNKEIYTRIPEIKKTFENDYEIV